MSRESNGSPMPIVSGCRRYDRRAAGPAVMSNAREVSFARLRDSTSIVYPVPMLRTATSVNVATPPTAVTVAPPNSSTKVVSPTNHRVTLKSSFVRRPLASWMWTIGCVRNGVPPVPVEGRLKDLAGQAGLSVLDAYYCIQRLLESRVLRLVEDQLAIVEAEQLRELLGQQGGGA